MRDIHNKSDMLKENAKNKLILQINDNMAAKQQISVSDTAISEVQMPDTGIIDGKINEMVSGVNDRSISEIYTANNDNSIQGSNEYSSSPEKNTGKNTYTDRINKQVIADSKKQKQLMTDKAAGRLSIMADKADNRLLIMADRADNSSLIMNDKEVQLQYTYNAGRPESVKHVIAERQNINAAVRTHKRNNTEKEIKDYGLIKDAALFGIFAASEKGAYDNSETAYDNKIITGSITDKDISDDGISICGTDDESYTEEYSDEDILYDNRKHVYESRKIAGNPLYKSREYRYYIKNHKMLPEKKNKGKRDTSLRGIKRPLRKAQRLAGDTYRGAKKAIKKGQNTVDGILIMTDDKEDGRISAISEINQRRVLLKYGNMYSNAVQRGIISVGKFSMKMIVKLAKYSFRLVSSFFGAIIGPFLAIPLSAMFLVVLLLNIPPLSWIMGGYSSNNMIVITYQDKLREFEMTIDAYDADDRSVINYTLDTDKARKDALLLFMAKKGLDYDFNNITEEDALLYGDLLIAMINYTCNISIYTEEIEDGALLTTKKIDVAVRASEDINGNNYGAYRADSCNVHGVISELNTRDGTYNHYIKEWFFIPCEVSQYSIIPVGTCLELSVTDDDGNINHYILQVVAKMDDENMDNEMLYLCGDWGSELDGVAKDENINTKAYGALSWFTYNASFSELSYPDKNVCYTGILDKKRAFQITDTYRLRYRSAEALAEEFEMTEEEKAEVFKDFYNATDEELEEAGIRVPLKTIYISNYDAPTYAQLNFSEEEIRRYNEVAKLASENEDLFEQLVKSLMGEISVSKTMGSLDTYLAEGDSYEDTTEFLADVLIENGFYIPNNASQLAKFCDDNGYTIQLQNYTQMQDGDICFVSTDEGTYKDVTDIYIKSKGGYIFCNGRTGKVELKKTLDYAETHRVGYNGEVMYARLTD